MPNAFTRTQTLGAFGKPKAIAISNAGAVSNALRFRKPASTATPPPPPAPGAFNISDALIQFADPVLKEARNNHTALRGAMNVAILVWNAIINGEAALAAARAQLLKLPGASEEQIDDLLAIMTARKAELYPDVKQLIRDYKLNFTKHGANIRVASINIAPPGVEKTPVATQLGAA
ncbi:MAG: hypothetical protein LBG65_07080 [Puniceicoccales bacterium]|jgi:hypothetical protein|nr:hypothetical protein [Puniceicoccales bacterium]